MTQPNRQRYRSYLLRCWAETDTQGEISLWRFSLEDPHTGQRRGFANLTELVIALQNELMAEEQGVGIRKQEVGSRKQEIGKAIR